MTSMAVLDRLTDAQVAAITVILESDGEPLAGQIAVIQCIVGRMRDRRWPDTLRGVCLQPKQFSCWNEGTDIRQRGLLIAEGVVGRSEGREVAQLRDLVERDLAGQLPVLAGRAVHYHRIDLLPRWSRGRTPVAVYGDHCFYTDVP